MGYSARSIFVLFFRPESATITKFSKPYLPTVKSSFDYSHNESPKSCCTWEILALFLRLILEKVLFLLIKKKEKVYPPSEIRKMSGVI